MDHFTTLTTVPEKHGKAIDRRRRKKNGPQLDPQDVQTEIPLFSVLFSLPRGAPPEKQEAQDQPLTVAGSGTKHCRPTVRLPPRVCARNTSTVIDTGPKALCGSGGPPRRPQKQPVHAPALALQRNNARSAPSAARSLPPRSGPRFLSRRPAGKMLFSTFAHRVARRHDSVSRTLS